MKKRNLLLLLLSLVLSVSMAFGFAACDDDVSTAYTVTYAAGGGTGDAPKSASYAVGTIFNVAENTFTREGYTFTSWSDGTDDIAEGAIYTMPAKNVTFTAQWHNDSLAEYTVTFDLGEYDGDEDAPDAITADEDSDITLPDVGVDWEDHTFLGWLEEGADGDPLEAGESYTVTKDVTLVAQWDDGGTPPPPTGVTHTVTFLANGATFKTVDVDDGTPVSEPDPAPTHPSKTFHHWATEDGAYDFATPVTDDLTLEASFWVYVDFDIDGAEGTAPAGVWGNSIRITSLTLPAADTFSKTSYTFGGWKDSENEVHAAGSTLTNITASMTLKAVWSSGSQTQKFTLSYYSGVYNGNGISGTTPAPEEKEVDAVITLPESPWTRTGYVFSSWKVQKEQENDYWVDVTTGLSVGDTYNMPAYNIRLVAVWTSAPTTTTYTIVYDPNGGSGTMANGSVESGKSIMSLPECIFTPPTGQQFVGWSLTADNSTGRIDGGIPSGTWAQYVKGTTLTIYAIWSGTGTTDPDPDVDPDAKYTITFEYQSLPSGLTADAISGTLISLEDAKAGDTVTVPVDLGVSALHYHISGFRPTVYVISNGEGSWENVTVRQDLGGSFTMPAGNVKIMLVWTANTVTISFNANGGQGEKASVTRNFNSSISFAGSAASDFVNTFTHPDGATFLGWGLSATASSRELIQNGFTLSAAYVADDDTITFFAIWDTTVAPDPEEQDIADFVGKWETELVSGNHTITIIAKAGEYGLVGYAVLDGKTFLTIYDVEGVLVAYNTDYEYVTDYTFALSGGTLTLREFDGSGAQGNTYNFTKKSDVPASAEGNLLGKWTRSATQKVLFEADGVAYYTVQGKIQEEAWLFVGEYLVFSYLASNGYDYYYILTKTDSGLGGFFLAPDVNPVAATFAQNGFYTLKVDGEYVQFVSEGSKPTAIDEPSAPNGKKFEGWVLVGTDTPFDFSVAMTADASIEAKFVDDNDAADHILIFIGEWKKGNKTLTKITIDTEKKTVVFTVNGVDGSAVTYTVTNDNLIFWDYDFSGEKLYLYINGDSLEIGDWYYGDSDTIHYATFTREGGSEGGGDEDGDDDDNPPANSSVVTFEGTWSGYAANVKIEINLETNEFIFTVNGTPREPVTATVIEAGVSWSIIGMNNPAGTQRWFKIDGDNLKIYNYAGWDAEDLEATLTKA